MVAPITNSPSLKKLAWALMRRARRSNAARHQYAVENDTRAGGDRWSNSSRRLGDRFGRRFAPEELAHPRVVAGVAQHLRVSFGNDALDALVEHDHAVGHGVNAGELVGHDDKGVMQVFAGAKDKQVDTRRGD